MMTYFSIKHCVKFLNKKLRCVYLKLQPDLQREQFYLKMRKVVYLVLIPADNGLICIKGCNI